MKLPVAISAKHYTFVHLGDNDFPVIAILDEVGYGVYFFFCIDMVELKAHLGFLATMGTPLVRLDLGNPFPVFPLDLPVNLVMGFLP